MRRRLTALLLATVLLYSAIAAVYGDSTYMVNADVYVGEGRGCYGPIKVGVTLEGDKIKDIQILEHNESPGVGAVAAELIADDIIKHQSIAVDAISGCTKSSNGVVTAVKEALKKLI